MFRYIPLVLAFVPVAFSQNQASYQWIRQPNIPTGQESFSGLGADAAGNTYVAGSTFSQTYPVKSAVQGHSASAGLYEISGTGSAFTPIGLSSVSFVTIDPSNSSIVYAVFEGNLLLSTDGGPSFTGAASPVVDTSSSQIQSVAIDPSNDKILYAATADQGLTKSTDGGATWSPSNGTLQSARPGQFLFQNVWIDPSKPNVLFATALGNFIRSGDSGASWQTIFPDSDIFSVSFDTLNPGVVYADDNQGNVFKSSDYGQTFAAMTTPTGFGVILADPGHPGRLVASTASAIYESDDGGATWTSKLKLDSAANEFLFVADWPSGYLYIASSSGVERISSDLSSATQVGPPSIGYIASIAAAGGRAYVADAASRDVYITKLDPSGSVVYSTYFGGSGDDIASTMAVDPAGNVYVAGSTSSLDFPVTKGAYASTGATFLFRLNPDGSVGYSTYFAPGGSTPVAMAVDSAGSAYLAGNTNGTLPTTPGAYQTTCQDCGGVSNGFFEVISDSGFISKFDPTGSTLVYSTYIGGAIELEMAVNAFALAPDKSAYVAGFGGIFHLNASGSALLGSLPPVIVAQAMGVAPDGSVYVAGNPGTGSNAFQTTAGSFESSISGPARLEYQVGSSPTAIGRWDAQLTKLLDATYFGAYAKTVDAIAFDPTGNVYLSGSTTGQGLPARTPLQSAFSSGTGFMSELTGDLSSSLFSSYLGDTRFFSVQGLALRSDGSIVLGGPATLMNATAGPVYIFINSFTLSPAPAVRIDSVQNAASLLDGPISDGDTILIHGAGFAADTQLTIEDTNVTPISISPNTIVAIARIPQWVPLSAVYVQVQSGGVTSNRVQVPVTAASPGIFSQNGSGFGQGYILNKDGTLNTPSNPASPGDPITIYANGPGLVSMTNGYAVTQYPVNVFIDDFYANGIAATFGPVSGFPGNVYKISVYVPNPATLVANNPDLKNFQFPPTVPVTMQINGVSSQLGIALSLTP